MNTNLKEKKKKMERKVLIQLLCSCQPTYFLRIITAVLCPTLNGHAAAAATTTTAISCKAQLAQLILVF